MPTRSKPENLASDSAVEAVFAHLAGQLAAERTRSVPDRNQPWPYVDRIPSEGPMKNNPPPPARLLRKALQRVGLHPEDDRRFEADLSWPPGPSGGYQPRHA